jgi:hypothetical protein
MGLFQFRPLGELGEARALTARGMRYKPGRRGSRPFYDPAFTHTMMRGLLAATLGQVAVLSLIKVTGILRGPQYPITSTSFWLHSPLHAAAVQSRRITRIVFSAVPGGPAGPSAP